MERLLLFDTEALSGEREKERERERDRQTDRQRARTSGVSRVSE